MALCTQLCRLGCLLEAGALHPSPSCSQGQVVHLSEQYLDSQDTALPGATSKRLLCSREPRDKITNLLCLLIWNQACILRGEVLCRGAQSIRSGVRQVQGEHWILFYLCGLRHVP